MDRERIIEAYIQRLLTWEKPLNKGTLAAISKEVGITPAEMHAIKRQAQAHFTRGRNYIQYGCWDDGINELTQAMALDPLNLDLLHALANAYNQRYNREEEPADRQKALLVAKRCVELKPNDKEALVLISFLEHRPADSDAKKLQWTQQKIGIVAGGMAAFSLALFGVTRLPVFSTPETLGPAPGTIVPGSVIYESTESVSVSPEATTVSAIDLLADVDIPVIFDHPGIVLESRLSQLGDFEDEVYYELHGVFINASDQEIRTLNLNAEFLDRNDIAISISDKAAIGSEDAIIRPGDTHSFSLIEKVTSELATVKLNITSLEQVTARPTYVPPTPINYSWTAQQPEHINFELASRSESFQAKRSTASDTKPSSTDDNKRQSGNFNAEWVIINTSDSPLQELKFKADFYNSNDRRLQSEEIVAISPKDAPLLPGEIRPFRILKSVASNYERYQVTVLEAE